MPENELELKSMLADTRLGVAEELGWTCAIFAALGLYAFFHSLFITIVGFGLAYYLVTLRYRRAANSAEDEFHKHAGIGKYSAHSSGDPH
ncbi:hypothetical protein GTP41_26095 [Pseudoduganella sp. DS3]|uniref:Uncharacterized protein n=1 Tax=Pseudoduganella guangdongensis TaxID=2692179 RepID=A0A6N9HPI7_9BURK|nr:hypothetical protein [Pseudoduganella guangdongensis]MYN05568.1 hypothetical protein [Pseudoduganella guangdongensis]